MKLSKLAGALMAAGLALVVGFSATASFAQNSDEDRPVPKKEQKAPKAGAVAAPTVTPLEMAATVIASSGVTCEASNARLIVSAAIDNIPSHMYEVACKTSPGFVVVINASDNAARDFYGCVQLAKAKETQKDAPSCTLAENLPVQKWMSPVMQKYVAGCDVDRFRMVGSGGEGDHMFDRIEVGCTNGGSGLLDYPRFLSKASVEFSPCLAYESTTSSSKCTLTTHAQMLDYMKPMAAQADAKCQATDVRYVAVNGEGTATYYEYGCATPPGFIVLINNNDQSLNRVIPCSGALALGGCKLSDAGLVAADANGQMTAVLKAAGMPCTVSDFDVKGSAGKRDYVEFKCPEQPFGLIGFVPQAGSEAPTDVYDCFMDQTARQLCTYVTPETLMKHLDKLIKVAEPTKNCDVKEVRYIGESSDNPNALLAELACVNKRGYIIEVAPNRQSLQYTRPCAIARSNKDEMQCEIAGNGTYSSAD
ncbi:hypothetical protein ABAC460_04400 [Asticcacaulis sp. AC460]|uniref:hypothetical protein n=1 Tax=Asticcacaulis sp. AC460 TaxID=1282360 RepID=UPI0003C3B744|nr:hypothetical protein [Asticcacaulis sp. AC460]ESQ92133.1 hypothetical protein ABAC460_04400 [Asticcacaulis sp. AC460]